MAEFRWLELHMGDIGMEHPTAIPVPGIPFVRVLQMRERKGPSGDGWWGDWHDIPVVGE